MNIYLRKIYYPQQNSEHNLTKINKNNVFKWKDKYNIKYNYHVDCPHAIYIDLDNNIIPSSIINHINSYQTINTIIIKINGELKDSNIMNYIFSKIKKTIKNKTIIFDLSNVRINNKIKMEIDSLPNNILFSMYNENNKYEKNPPKEDIPNDICWWAMNLDDNDFISFCNHTTENTKKYLLKMRKVAYDFHNQVKKIIPKMNKVSSKEKADIAYKWISSNIGYNWNPINNEEVDLDDPLDIIVHKKGNSKGKTKLLKLLLNNYYMKVPCYIDHGETLTGKEHTWNEVYDRGKRLYYDISYGKKATTYVNHLNIDRTEYNLSGYIWKQSKTSSQSHKEKTYKKVSTS